MRHLARGENGEHAALVQPLHGLLQGATVALLRLACVQWIDEDAALLELRHAFEQEVGQDFDVRTRTRQHYGEHGAVEQTIRMIGDNHHRPLLRDTLEVGGIHLQINIHLAQQVFEDRMLASFAGSLVEVMNLLQRQELAGESRQSGKRGSMGEHTRVDGIFEGRQNGHGYIVSAPTFRLDERQMKCW